jgi:AcrR family transcriptional regulator
MTDLAPKYVSSQDRRREIAAATRSLIVEKGFEGLRMREIADRVGINIATLHYHVPSKEALVELVAQSMRDDFIAQHLRHHRDGRTPLERLVQQIAEFRETRDQNPELLKVMEELTRRAKYDENVARHVSPLRQRWHLDFVDIVEAGVADGTFRPDLDPQAAAYMVIGAMIATSADPISGADPLDLVAAELLRSFTVTRSKD